MILISDYYYSSSLFTKDSRQDFIKVGNIQVRHEEKDVIKPLTADFIT